MEKTFVEWAVRVFTTVAVLTGLSGCATPTQPVSAGTEIDTATQVNVVIPSATPEFTVTSVPTTNETATEAKTPTPEGVDYSQAFFDPQSEADFPEVIEAPSPIDDPADFTVWQEGYLAAVDEKLANYTGPSIDGTVFAFGYDFGQVELASDEWPVVAAYKFVWQGQEMLTKTFIINDGKGNLTPLSITYTTPNSIIFDPSMRYKTPTKRLFMLVFFDWNTTDRGLYHDNFISDYLSGSSVDTFISSMGNIYSGKDSEMDRALISRTRLVMCRLH